MSAGKLLLAFLVAAVAVSGAVYYAYRAEPPPRTDSVREPVFPAPGETASPRPKATPEAAVAPEPVAARADASRVTSGATPEPDAGVHSITIEPGPDSFAKGEHCSGNEPDEDEDEDCS